MQVGLEVNFWVEGLLEILKRVCFGKYVNVWVGGLFGDSGKGLFWEIRNKKSIFGLGACLEILEGVCFGK